MDPNDKQPVMIGVFEDERNAQDAIKDLSAHGFLYEHIGILAHERLGSSVAKVERLPLIATEEKAAAGMAAGASVGALWGLAVAAGLLPPFGTVIAGGTLAAILASTATGAAVGGITGGLVGLGVSDEHAHYYESEFQAGRTLVSVKTQGRNEDAMDILIRNGGYDIRTRMLASAERVF